MCIRDRYRGGYHHERECVNVFERLALFFENIRHDLLSEQESRREDVYKRQLPYYTGVCTVRIPMLFQCG